MINNRTDARKTDNNLFKISNLNRQQKSWQSVLASFTMSHQFSSFWGFWHLEFYHPSVTPGGLMNMAILVPWGQAHFGQHRESWPLRGFNAGSLWFTEFPSLCACLLGVKSDKSDGLRVQNEFSTCILKKWTWPEVAILGADQKKSRL